MQVLLEDHRFRVLGKLANRPAGLQQAEAPHRGRQGAVVGAWRFPRKPSRGTVSLKRLAELVLREGDQYAFERPDLVERLG
jgi:hypothetical protein